MMALTAKKRHSSSPDYADDRISALPDDILHQILSFMDLKQIIATAVLSKRWRALWKSAPTIFLDWCKNADAITHSLAMYQAPRIRKFHALIDRHYVIDETIESWIKFAVTHGVKEFYLDIFANYDGDNRIWISLPRWLFECESLEVMRLASCGVDLESGLSLRLLRSLQLCHVVVSDLDVSGCPVLQCVTLKDCNSMGHLNVIAPNQMLECLKIEDISEVVRYDSALTVYAPYLPSIQFRGHIRRKYNASNLASVRTAKLEFYSDGGRGYEFKDTLSLLDLLHYVRKAPTLVFSQWCIQIFSRWDAKEMKLPPFSATHLKLEFSFSETELTGMAFVLKSTCSIEALDLHTGDSPIQAEKWDSYFYRDFVVPWGVLEHSFSMIHHLKTIEINNALPTKSYSCVEPELHRGIDMYLEEWKKEFKIAGLLLSSFNTLEKMTICTVLPSSWSLKSEFLLRLEQKLLSFSKASMNARVELLESNHVAWSSNEVPTFMHDGYQTSSSSSSGS